MHAALHDGHGNVAHFADHEPAGVAFDRRAREAGNFVVGNARGGGEFVGERAEAGAEHQADFRAQLRSRWMNFAAREARAKSEAAGLRVAVIGCRLLTSKKIPHPEGVRG